MEMSESEVLLTALVSATLLLTGINTVQLNNMEAASGTSYEQVSLPKGVPDVYGQELGVSFSDVSRDRPNATRGTLRKMVGLNRINLTQRERNRVADIAYRMHGGISCEYCCEAESIVTKNGKPACGCSHALAMTGLVSYLVKEHPEMSDEEIFRELAKWKTRFFPSQTRSKSRVLQEKGVEPTFVNLASNEYRGVGSGKGGWVGDC